MEIMTVTMSVASWASFEGLGVWDLGFRARV